MDVAQCVNNHVSYEEAIQINVLLEENHSMRYIAAMLGVQPSTIGGTVL